MTENAKIIEMVKDHLHITHELDDSSRRRLSNTIADGIALIRRRCDPAATCEPGTPYADLLKEYVLYAESGAREIFEKDFSKELTASQIETDVMNYAAAMGYSDA